MTPPVPTHAALQRPAYDGFLARVALHPQEGSAAALLSEDPDALTTRALALSDLALGLLPVGALSPAQRALYGRIDLPLLATLCGNVSEALRILGSLGVRMDVSAEQLDELLGKHGAFQSFELLGTQVTSSALDQRVICGAFLVFCLQRVVEAVDARYHDAALSQPQREALLSDFAPALMALDDVLRYPTERREDLAADRQELATAAEAAEADAHLADTLLRIRQELYVPREELFQAARRHMERSRGAATSASATLAPPPGPRRIV